MSQLSPTQKYQDQAYFLTKATYFDQTMAFIDKSMIDGHILRIITRLGEDNNLVTSRYQYHMLSES
ncbi:MAG: hypothetical protein RJQ09_14300 [Cyclobacteriaceae bacterium]